MKNKTANLHFPIYILGYPTCPKSNSVPDKIYQKKSASTKNISEIHHSTDTEWENKPEGILRLVKSAD